MNSESETTLQFSSWSAVKQFLIIFLPLLALVGGIIAVLFYTEEKAERIILETNEVYEVELHKKTIVSDIKSAVTDLMILSELYDVRKMLEDIEGELKGEMSFTFRTFSKQKGLYDQIRILDKTGLEVVRVNFNDGYPYAVPKDKLQFIRMT